MCTCEETLVRLRVTCIWEWRFRSHPDPWSRTPGEPIDVFIGIRIDITGLSVLAFTIENDFICWVESSIVFATDKNRYLFSFIF